MKFLIEYRSSRVKMGTNAFPSVYDVRGRVRKQSGNKEEKKNKPDERERRRERRIHCLRGNRLLAEGAATLRESTRNDGRHRVGENGSVPYRMRKCSCHGHL
ncbi:hypothetical protein PUN28_006796 [Cardiocondyla obscurior]|uniref:Uncharacterized protein n=1 Tax=Cardiocondyla obscurior TaxID=286306 RepID=A0AAW2G1X0_9HYME